VVSVDHRPVLIHDDRHQNAPDRDVLPERLTLLLSQQRHHLPRMVGARR
jgi:hypothetical protein